MMKKIATIRNLACLAAAFSAPGLSAQASETESTKPGGEEKVYVLEDYVVTGTRSSGGMGVLGFQKRNILGMHY